MKEVLIVETPVVLDIQNERPKAFSGESQVTLPIGMDDVLGLIAALAGKAGISHTHLISEVVGLVAALAGKADLVGGIIPSCQLPSYVDDVLEYSSINVFPTTGETGKIYVDVTTNLSYRWSGTQYVQTGSPLSLGTTATTAFRGDQGLAAYNHSLLTGNPHNTLMSDIVGLLSALAGKADLVNGLIPANQLPSYVDDVLEYATLAAFPATGEAGKIYVDISTNKAYRWAGSSYVVIMDGLALGTTSSTAFRGDQGLAAYNHSIATGNPHNTAMSDIAGLVSALALKLTTTDRFASGMPNGNAVITLAKVSNVSVAANAGVAAVETLLQAIQINPNNLRATSQLNIFLNASSTGSGSDNRILIVRIGKSATPSSNSIYFSYFMNTSGNIQSISDLLIVSIDGTNARFTQTGTIATAGAASSLGMKNAIQTLAFNPASETLYIHVMYNKANIASSITLESLAVNLNW